VFRDYQTNFIDASNIGVSYALHADLMRAILVIEIVFHKGWHRL
jgi:hypothetical protein